MPDGLRLQTDMTDGREKDTGPSQTDPVALRPPLTPAVADTHITDTEDEAPWWQLGHHASRLGGALADLVNRPAVSPDVLSDAETPSPLPDSADEEQTAGHAGKEIVMNSPSMPAAPVQQPPQRMTIDLLTDSKIDMESAMLLGGGAPITPHQVAAQSSDAAATTRAGMGWASGFMARLRSRSNSPVTASNGEEASSQQPGDRSALMFPEATTPAVDNLPRTAPRREGIGDPFALTKIEEEQQRLMREAVVRDFGKKMDHHRVEITESIVKATGDLGKNFGKAGDKLLKVWDLNDLKDDTIEMKQHYEEDIKEDLGNIKQDLGKHVENVGNQLNTVKGNLGNIKDDLGMHVASVGLHLRNGGVKNLLEDLSNMTSPRISRASSPVANRTTSSTERGYTENIAA